MFQAAEPAHSIFNYLQHGFLVEDPVGLVPRPEIEDFAFVDIPYRGGAKPFTGRPALLDDHLVGIGNVEGFVVHLGIGNGEVSRQVPCNRVVGLEDV